MVALLILDYKLDPRYVLDDMSLYEMRGLLEYGWYAHREGWEQTRFQAYVTAQTQSTKKLKVSDLMKFPWDINSNEEATPDQLKQLEEKSKKYAQLFANQ